MVFFKILAALGEILGLLKPLIGRLIKTPQEAVVAVKQMVRDRNDKFRRTGRPTWGTGRGREK